MSRGAVVLLSGGLDSATTLAVARSEGYDVYALSVDYGQRHRRELECAAAQARLQGVKEHRVIRLDLRAVGGSALTDAIDVPKDRPHDEMSRGIPVTYVLFPDEGHGFARPENNLAFNATTEHFLERCLGGRAEPFGTALKGSSIQVLHGAEYSPGLKAAVDGAATAGQ